MAKFMIKRRIDGVSTLTALGLQAVATTSHAIVARLGEHFTRYDGDVAGDTIHGVHQARSEEAVRRHGRRAGCPVDEVRVIGAVVGPHAAFQ